MPLETRETPEDIGFKVFNLSQLKFKDWKPYRDNNATQLGILFYQFESPLVASWTPENLLLQGFPLDSRIRPLAEFQSNSVLEITPEFCQHRLYVCLDAKIQLETVQSLSLRPEDILVALDSALADQVNLKVI